MLSPRLSALSLRRQLPWLAQMLLVISLASCGTLELSLEETPATGQGTDTVPPATEQTSAPTQLPVATASVATSASTPVLESTSPAQTVIVPSPVPTRTPYSAPLPAPLYFLSKDGANAYELSRTVWQLAPSSETLDPVTPPELQVTSFDIWPQDGRLAYGTWDGQLFVVLPGEEPRLLYDAGLDAGGVISIDSLAWSPEGARLAVTTRSRERSDEDLPDGLWLVPLSDGVPVKLLSNRHFDPAKVNVNEVRSIADPVWSPDGSALLLTGLYWEWSDILLLDPVEPHPAESNLHDLPGELWLSGSWTGDGQSILLSGTGYGIYSDLVRVDRDSLELERLLDGEAEGLFVNDAQEIPSGLAFLASHFDGDGETQLFLGNQADGQFRYRPSGPQRNLCEPGYVRDVAWDSTGSLATVSCDEGVLLISLDGTTLFDLAPFLGQLVKDDYLKVFWGKN